MNEFDTLMLNNGVFPKKVLLSITKTLSFNTFLQFELEWFKKIRFQWLIIGNIKKEDVIPIVKETEDKIKNFKNNKKEDNVLSQNDVIEIRTINLPLQYKYIYPHYLSKEMGDDEPNSAILVHFQGGKETPRSKFLCKILKKFIDEPCFDRLRTDEQIGYAVFSWDEYNRGIFGYTIVLLSASYSPIYMSQRIELFLKELKNDLEEMDDEEFEEDKESVLLEVTQKNKNLFEEANKYWKEITTNKFLFNRSKLIIKKL